MTAIRWPMRAKALAAVVGLATNVGGLSAEAELIQWDEVYRAAVTLNSQMPNKEVEVIPSSAHQLVPGDRTDFTLTVQNDDQHPGIISVYLKAITFGVDGDGNSWPSTLDNPNGLGTFGSLKPDAYYEEITLSSREHWDKSDVVMLTATSLEQLAADLAEIVDITNPRVSLPEATECVSGKGCLLSKETVKPGESTTVVLTMDFPVDSESGNDFEDFPVYFVITADIWPNIAPTASPNPPANPPVNPSIASPAARAVPPTAVPGVRLTRMFTTGPGLSVLALVVVAGSLETARQLRRRRHQQK